MNVEELLCDTDKSGEALKKVETSTEALLNSVKTYEDNIKEYIRLEREHISTIEDAIAKGDVPEGDAVTAICYVMKQKGSINVLEKYLDGFSTIMMGVILNLKDM